MNDYPQTITRPSTSASVGASIALFAVVAAFLLITGAGLAMGAFQVEANVSPPQQQPLCGFSSGSPGKP